MSDYLRLRRTFGLSDYTEEQMPSRLAAAGFAAKHAPRNIGYKQ